MKVFRLIVSLIVISIVGWLGLGLAEPVLGRDNQVTIYFFWGKGCPHCAKEKAFLDQLEADYPQVRVKSLPVNQADNLKLWQQATEKLGAEFGYTPFTVIGSQYFVGYLDDRTTGRQIETAVKQAIESGCPDVLSRVDQPRSSPCPTKGFDRPEIPESLDLPVFGQVKIQKVSLPLLTLIMGVLDGFNPCAMWTLLFLISLLLGMEDRKRMWSLGVAFIVVSALVYFLFMSAWLNLFLFLGVIDWVRLVVGVVALLAGGYSLRDWYVNRQGGCRIVEDEQRRRVFEKIREVVNQQNFVLALGGIILLAFAVNLVELVCSAGLPAIYTQVLSLNNLPVWQYYLYLLGYVFFFMVDDLLIFFTAMMTLKAVGIEGKYARFSRLVGGFLILLIGLLLIFKPGWLMFG